MFTCLLRFKKTFTHTRAMDEEIEYRTETGFIRARARRRRDLSKIMRLIARWSILMLWIQSFVYVIIGALMLYGFVWEDAPLNMIAGAYTWTGFIVATVADYLVTGSWIWIRR